jgi:phosphoserine aminotransferase
VRLFEETEARLKSLLGVGDAYRVLFLPGGATLQFSQVPMNLLAPNESAAYLTTGAWSQKAIKEASKYGNAVEVASSTDSNFTTMPAREAWQLRSDAKYFHICTNETIHGVEWFGSLADLGMPVVADMSSHLLSRSMPIHEFDLIYAGAQKNLGTAGVTIVVVKQDLLKECQPSTPGLMDYQSQIANDSMVNTPPVYPVWVLSLVMEWLESLGGVSAVEKINRQKAESLYQAIDSSSLYRNPVAHDCRSLMNIPFVLADESLDSKFIDASQSAGLLNLKGHRSVGGMRASIYNAITQSEVDTLIEFMHEFERVAA